MLFNFWVLFIKFFQNGIKKNAENIITNYLTVKIPVYKEKNLVCKFLFLYKGQHKSKKD